MRIFIAVLLLAFGPARALLAADDVGLPPDDLKAIRAARLTLDDASLLGFLKSRILADADRSRILALIRNLGDDDFDTRDQASTELERIGAPAVPLLRQAVRDPDIEVVHRAERCLKHIDKLAGPAVTCAVCRALAKRKPDGAAATLLAFAPFADDDVVSEEVRAALAAVALKDGKPDPAILDGLADKLPLKRAVAAEALIRSGSETERKAMRRMLKDDDPTVRLHVAVQLHAFKDLEAVPVLIALLSELPYEKGRQAEGHLAELGGELSPNVVLGEEDAAKLKCRKAWENWWKTYDGPGLLKYLQERTLSDTAREHVLDLIKQLKDDAFEVRAKAAEELSKCGPSAIPLLHRALYAADPEVAQRAKKALESIDKDRVRGSAGAGDAARLLALHRPEGAVEALLAFLPSAEDEDIDEIRTALSALATRDGKAHAALVKALADSAPERRVGAAVALARGGPKEERDAVRKLLKDDDPAVRLPVAEALIPGGDKDAVVTVIDLLLKLPPEQVWQAETVLCSLAEDKAPPPLAAFDETSRKKAHAAWSDWWKQNAAKVDLAKLDQPGHLLGFTLVAVTNRGRNGSVMELGRDGKPRWQIEGIAYPMDARMIGADRVLVAEYSGHQVTERSTKGDILWSQRVQFPLACQRLPNGNTFIVTRNQLLEVDRNNKEVFTHARNANDIMTGQKLRNGQMLFITNQGSLVRLDATGKEMKTVNLPAPQVYGTNIEPLPNGRILVPQFSQNAVVEYDQDGKPLWKADVQQPTSVQRLPNGHTLVASMYTMQMIELDRQGKEVSTTRLEGRVNRVRRR
jgi:HEAT repeat protein